MTKKKKQPVQLSATRDIFPKSEDSSYYAIILSQLKAGIVKSNVLISEQLHNMLANKDVCYPDEQYTALRAARREFESLGKDIQKTLTKPDSINKQVVTTYIARAHEIHKNRLQEPAKKHTQLRTLANVVKSIIYKAARLIHSDYFFGAYHKNKQAQVAAALVKETKRAITVKRDNAISNKAGLK